MTTTFKDEVFLSFQSRNEGTLSSYSIETPHKVTSRCKWTAWTLSCPDCIFLHITPSYLQPRASAAVADFPVVAALAMDHVILMIINPFFFFFAVTDVGDPCTVLTGR